MPTSSTFKAAALSLAIGSAALVLALRWVGRDAAGTTIAGTGAAEPTPAVGLRGREIDSARREPDLGPARDVRPATPPDVPLVAPVLEQPRPPEPRPDAPPAELPSPPPVLGEAAQAAHDASVELRQQVTADVSAQLQRQRSALKQACGGTETFVYDLSLGADGTVLAMGLSEPRASGASGVGACLRAQPITLDVAAPGESMNVQVALELD